MSRPPTKAAPVVRTRTLEGVELADLLPFDEITSQSQADLPKVVPGAKDPEQLSSPSFAKFSKMLLSQDSRVLRPPHLSEWAKIGSFPSPLGNDAAQYNRGLTFVSNNETILVDIISNSTQTTISREFLRAGPRDPIAFHPTNECKPCIVTCGGLCPGINSVIRELVVTLVKVYKVRSPIKGIPYGLCGFYQTDLELVDLTLASVETIHHTGGSILGSSRGGFDCKRICDAIESYGFNQVFLIGGDGSHRAGMKLYEELKLRRSKVCLAGLAKTVDNDLPLIDRSFGFDTGVTEAQRAIECAKVEARSAINGIGLVKLMGRHSGQIAMFACLASREVDCCLIPEIDFVLEGQRGLFANIRDCLRVQKHMVIVVAEGAGLEMMQSEMKGVPLGHDASGNVKLPDIGVFLKEKINSWAGRNGLLVNVKLIDPTYQIRSVPANASDQLYCSLLAQSAVHGAMAGYTGFTVGMINTHFVMIPIGEMVGRGRCKVDVKSRMWQRLLTATGQPILDGGKSASSGSLSELATTTTTAAATQHLQPQQASPLPLPVAATATAAVVSGVSNDVRKLKVDGEDA